MTNKKRFKYKIMLFGYMIVECIDYEKSEINIQRIISLWGLFTYVISDETYIFEIERGGNDENEKEV